MFSRRLHLLIAACASVALICAAAPLTAVRAAGRSKTPQLEQLRQELVRLGRAQQAGESVSEGWKRKLLELNARQADLDKRMGQNRDSLVQMMGALQMFRRDPPPSLLVNPRSAKNAVRAAILIRAVLPALEARRRDYVAEANELNRIRRDAAVAGAALLSAASAEADRRSRIDQLVAAKSGLEAAVDPAAAARAASAAAKARTADELVGDLASSDRPDAAWVTAFARAMKTAYAERLDGLGDADPMAAETCTTHITVCDAEGNVVVMTTTLLSSMGSRVVLPNSGVLMNNGVMWFDPAPNQPNSIAPGKRPLTNMSPIILNDGDRPWLAAGASGGRRILASVAQIMTFVADFGMTLEQAAHQPRIDVSGPDGASADIRLPPEVIAALEAEGPTEVVEHGVMPINFACPNVIALNADGSRTGISDAASPWSAAVAQT